MSLKLLLIQIDIFSIIFTMDSLYIKLKKNLEDYHNIIETYFLEDWELNISKENYQNSLFIDALFSARDGFLQFCKDKKINYATMAGTLQEWVIFHFLNSGLKVCKKDNKACVVNRYKIPFESKKKGNKYVNLDIVIKDMEIEKIYYAFEVKTNFEDGFKKFISEKNFLYPHRKNVFNNFKYYYLSINHPPKILRYSDDIETLLKHEELYILNKKKTELPGPIDFIKSIHKSILEI